MNICGNFWKKNRQKSKGFGLGFGLDSPDLEEQLL
jgi:hypothetical protein